MTCSVHDLKGISYQVNYPWDLNRLGEKGAGGWIRSYPQADEFKLF